jgi:hypothetical protein
LYHTQENKLPDGPQLPPLLDDPTLAPDELNAENSLSGRGVLQFTEQLLRFDIFNVLSTVKCSIGTS